MTRTLLLFGAGPGIGDHVAACFASQGGIEHVVLLGRNHARLTNEDAPFVQKAAPGVKVSIVRADLSDVDSIPKILEELDALTKGEHVEVVYYNAARIQPTAAALDVGVKEIEEDFRVLHYHLS
jgi:NAD(P)-dependent dehydrogenase (short-subunit alcohol dehydrogenase family)